MSHRGCGGWHGGGFAAGSLATPESGQTMCGLPAGPSTRLGLLVSETRGAKEPPKASEDESGQWCSSREDPPLLHPHDMCAFSHGSQGRPGQCLAIF